MSANHSAQHVNIKLPLQLHLSDESWTHLSMARRLITTDNLLKAYWEGHRHQRGKRQHQHQVEKHRRRRVEKHHHR